MKGSEFDRVVCLSGRVHAPHHGVSVFYESDARRSKEMVDILRLGGQEILVAQIPENVGLSSSGGRALVVLLFIGVVLDCGVRKPVYTVIDTIYNPSSDQIRAANGCIESLMSAQPPDIPLDQQVLEVVRGVLHEFSCEGKRTS